MKGKLLAAVSLVLAFMLLASVAGLAFTSVPVKQIALDKELKLTEGDTYALKAVISPKDATNKKLKWESSSKKIAAVDANGTVKALKAGKATITAWSADGKVSAKCVVTVAASKKKLTPLKVKLMSWSINKDNTEGIKNDRILKLMREKFNMEFEFISADGQAEKYSTTLAAGDVPDILFSWNNTQAVNKAVEEGMMLDMNAVVSKNPERYPVLVKMFSDPLFKYYNSVYFGSPTKYYGLPSMSLSRYVFGGIIFNMKEMKRLGLQMPSTLDEFISVLRAVKKGSKMMPFTLLSYKGTRWDEFNQIFFQPQGGDLRLAVLGNDGKYVSYVTNPANKNIWKQVAQYYKEGLIDREIFTKDAFSHLGEFNGLKLFSAAGMLPYDSPIMNWWFRDILKQPGYTMEDAALLPRPFKGISSPGFPVSAAGYTYVSAKTKDPERVLDFLNWVFSKEGQITVYYGIEGIHHKKNANGEPVIIQKEWDKETNNWGQKGAMYWPPFNALTSTSGHIIDTDNSPSWQAALGKAQEKLDIYAAGSVKDRYLEHGTEVTRNFLQDAYKPLPAYAAFNYSEAENKIISKINDCMNKYFVGFVTGKIDIDKEWDKFVKDFKDLDPDIIERAAQGYYDKNKKLYNSIGK